MKTLKTILLVVAVIIFTACEGPMGPEGAPGLNGKSFLGSVFEVEGDFTANNNYAFSFDFPSNFEIYNTDMVLVYILWEQANGSDVWRLLPQTVVLKTINNSYSETDVLQYNFDYTVNDVRIFLEGTMDMNTLLPAETDNQVFRIVVLPADFLAKKSVDINDLNKLIEMPELKIGAIEKVVPTIH
ncbi:MAG: hypothetical protein CSA36_03470 [Draconibacterium sp.]|nr:MAG: hypothetical protein CSA36_03470 [Draconibacterium sp.]